MFSLMRARGRSEVSPHPKESHAPCALLVLPIALKLPSSRREGKALGPANDAATYEGAPLCATVLAGLELAIVAVSQAEQVEDRVQAEG